MKDVYVKRKAIYLYVYAVRGVVLE